MDSDKSDNSEKPDVRPRSKHGARSFLPGPRLSIALSLMQKQLTQLDRLAIEIRAARGIWLTRSGIITAFIEASFRCDPETELPTANENTRDI